MNSRTLDDRKSTHYASAKTGLRTGAIAALFLGGSLLLATDTAVAQGEFYDSYQLEFHEEYGHEGEELEEGHEGEHEEGHETYDDPLNSSIDALLLDEEATPEAGSVEQGGEGETDLVRRKFKLTVKNASSLDKRVSVYDNVCRRTLVYSRRLDGWEALKVRACEGDNGFADITVKTAFGAKKKRFAALEDRDVLRFR